MKVDRPIQVCTRHEQPSKQERDPKALCTYQVRRGIVEEIEDCPANVCSAGSPPDSKLLTGGSAPRALRDGMQVLTDA